MPFTNDRAPGIGYCCDAEIQITLGCVVLATRPQMQMITRLDDNSRKCSNHGASLIIGRGDLNGGFIFSILPFKHRK